MFAAVEQGEVLGYTVGVIIFIFLCLRWNWLLPKGKTTKQSPLLDEPKKRGRPGSRGQCLVVGSFRVSSFSPSCYFPFF